MFYNPNPISIFPSFSWRLTGKMKHPKLRRRSSKQDQKKTLEVFTQLPDAVKERIIGMDCPAKQCWKAHVGHIRPETQEYAKRCGPVVRDNLRRLCFAFRDPAKFKHLVDTQVHRLVKQRIDAQRIEVDISVATVSSMVVEGGVGRRSFFAQPSIYFTTEDGTRHNEVYWVDQGGEAADNDESSVVFLVNVKDLNGLHIFRDDLQDLLFSLAMFWQSLQSVG